MRNVCCNGSAIAGMLFFYSFFLGLTLAIYPGWDVVGQFLDKNLLLTKEAPAWVQAVGSVSAIYFAATSARKHVDSSIRIKSLENLENNKNMADTCLEITRGLVSVSIKCNRLACRGEGLHLERINDLQETLRILLTKDMPVDLLRNVFSLQKILADYKENMIITSKKEKSTSEFNKLEVCGDYLKHRKNLGDSVSVVRNKLKNYINLISEKMD